MSAAQEKGRNRRGTRPGMWRPDILYDVEFIEKRPLQEVKKILASLDCGVCYCLQQQGRANVVYKIQVGALFLSKLTAILDENQIKFVCGVVKGTGPTLTNHS